MAGRFSVRKMKKRLRKLPGHAKIQVKRPKKRNAGPASIRKTKKQWRGIPAEFRKPFTKYYKQKAKSTKKIRKTAKNPTVYDSAGKPLGKFSRKAAQIVARAVGGRVRPTIAFRTKAALLKYAHEHGLKIGSMRKVPR